MVPCRVGAERAAEPATGVIRARRPRAGDRGARPGRLRGRRAGGDVGDDDDVDAPDRGRRAVGHGRDRVHHAERRLAGGGQRLAGRRRGGARGAARRRPRCRRSSPGRAAVPAGRSRLRRSRSGRARAARSATPAARPRSCSWAPRPRAGRSGRSIGFSRSAAERRELRRGRLGAAEPRLAQPGDRTARGRRRR